MTFQQRRAFHIGGASWLLLCAIGNGAMAEDAAPTPSSATQLPEISVTAPRISQAPRRPKKRVLTGERRPPPAAAPQTEAQVVAGKNDQFDEARRNIVAAVGAGKYRTEPAGDRGAAARHQHHAGQGVAAGSRRIAGFGRKR